SVTEKQQTTKTGLMYLQICGAGIFGLGIFLKSTANLSVIAPSIPAVNVVNGLFILGIFITCVSFLGFLGALKENRCLYLVVYSFICVFIYICIYSFIYLFIYSLIYLYIYLFLHLFKLMSFLVLHIWCHSGNILFLSSFYL
uniref:Uncharacterized protein n=1 Tax=Astyanax mexicanus TaxID=7994 RepID=A0A8B9JUJ6_ASTMX